MHRNIRYTNILVDENGFVKIIDFGFEKQIFSKSDFDRSYSSLNWWCQVPEDFQANIYDFKTELYFIGKLFEKLILDNEITSFSYNHILAKMCELNHIKRINSFENVQREIIKNENFDKLFNNSEKHIYQNFANELSQTISCIYKNTNYYSDIEVIQNKLSELYKNVMLEKIIPDNTKIIKCFINGSYKYFKRKDLQIDTLKQFLIFLKSCSKEKKNIILNNLHSRFDSIDRIDNNIINEEEIPF